MMRNPGNHAHPLTPQEIRDAVPAGCIGFYTLYILAANEFRAVYAGRSDTDLRRRLLTHCRNQKATYFTFKVLDTVERAFVLECSAYHASTGITNLIHPAKPAGTALRCPFCWDTLAVARLNWAQLPRRQERPSAS